MPDRKIKISDSNPKARSSKGMKASISKVGWIRDIRSGRTISFELFRKNAWLFVAFIVIVLSLIGMRYKTKTNMQVINKLKTELERAKSLKLSEKAKYMTLIRETEMKELVREKNLNLEFQDKPPYEIIDSEN